MPDEQPIESPNANGTFGIPAGLWRTVGNMSAMAIISGAFLYLGNDYLKMSKEDRVMFRDTLKGIQDAQDKRYEKTEMVYGKAMEKMGSTVERAVTALESAVKEVQKTNTIRPGGSAPPGDDQLLGVRPNVDDEDERGRLRAIGDRTIHKADDVAVDHGGIRRGSGERKDDRVAGFGA